MLSVLVKDSSSEVFQQHCLSWLRSVQQVIQVGCSHRTYTMHTHITHTHHFTPHFSVTSPILPPPSPPPPPPPPPPLLPSPLLSPPLLLSSPLSSSSPPSLLSSSLSQSQAPLPSIQLAVSVLQDLLQFSSQLPELAREVGLNSTLGILTSLLGLKSEVSPGLCSSWSGESRSGHRGLGWAVLLTSHLFFP